MNFSQLSPPVLLSTAQRYFIPLKSDFMLHELKFIQDNKVYVLRARSPRALELNPKRNRELLLVRISLLTKRL